MSEMAGDEDDGAAVDRAFADLVAGFHLTSDRPDPLGGIESAHRTVQQAATPPEESFFFLPPATNETPSQPDERYVPPAPAPIPRPAWPVLIAWIGLGYAVLIMLAVVVGMRPPAWLSWMAVIGFVGAFTILVTHLPRHRPPDAGDGAVL